jgi:hypothetical protein
MYLLQNIPYHPVTHKFVYGKGVWYKGWSGGLLEIAQFHGAPTDTTRSTAGQRQRLVAHWKLFQPRWIVSASTPVTVLFCLYRLRLGVGGRMIDRV